MLPKLHTRTLVQALFGLLLVCWPVLDTAPTGAVTPLRIGLAAVTTLLFVAANCTTARKQPTRQLHLVDWGVILCAGWFILRVLFHGSGEVDPYPLLNGWTLLTAYGLCRAAGTELLLPALTLSGLVQSSLAFAQTVGLVASRHTYHSLTGSFPNPGPLGGWLCIGALAATLLAVQARRDRQRVTSLSYAAAAIYIGIALWLTDSRAAWVGAAGGLFWLLVRSGFRYKRVVLRASAVVAGIGILLLYPYKKESADGRLLVWRVSADLAAQRPLAGHGIGSFPERYMPAQAAYFTRHPDSRFAAVADQVNHPFNELVGTICEQGAIGGLLALLVIGAAIAGRGAAHTEVLLVGLFAFGQFSYPSSFLAFNLLFAAVLAGCANGSSPIGRPLPGRAAGVIGAVVLIGGTVLLPELYRAGQTTRNRYVLLQEVSATMRRPLPTDLPRMERLARRLPIAELYTDLGDRWLEADSIERAKSCYRRAARMIPARLRPYDGLLRAYRLSGEIDSATLMARRILTLPVKVSNTTTLRLRREARQWLDE